MRTTHILIFLAILLVASCIPPGSETKRPVANPSGQHIGSFACRTDADCIIGGCSNTICQSKQGEQIMSICEWRDEYTCYQSIPCGCNAGLCAWEKTPEFQSCFAEKSKTSGEVQ